MNRLLSTWLPLVAFITLAQPVQAQPEAPSLPREFRAAWVATVGNIDWPSRPGLNAEDQKREALRILDLAHEAGLNCVILQVRTAADALYNSPLEPWSAYLSGQQGVPPSPAYDPLEFWVDQAHRRGLLLHAWINPFRARIAGAKYQESPSHVSKTRPDLVRNYGASLWLDPGEPEARDQTLKVVLDIVKRYDVDGIHIDDYFYPYPIADPATPGKEVDFPDEASWQKARGSGVTLARDDWRRDNISRLVEQLARSIKAEKPQVLFGISPFGIARPGQPPVARGFDQYARLYADTVRWLQQGWADYYSPQLYWKVEAPGQPFQPLLDYWVSVNPQKRHIWPGLSISRVRQGGYDPSEILRQVALTRQTPGASGNVLFSFKALAANPLKLTDRIKAELYPQPALIPTTPWIKAEPPGQPTVTAATVDFDHERLTVEVQPGQGTAPFLWALQLKQNDRWTFHTRPGTLNRLTIDVEADLVVVSAVDRLGNVSKPVAIKPKQRVE